MGQSFSPGSAITEESSLLSGEYIDLGIPPFKMMPGKSCSVEDWELPTTEEVRWISLMHFSGDNIILLGPVIFGCPTRGAFLFLVVITFLREGV